MPSGDRQRTSFPEVVETLRAAWRAQSQVVGEALEKVPRVELVRSLWEVAPLTGA
jgi:hypothetical protein